jgi:hypothetical protein
MATNPIGALPTAIPPGIAGDPTAQQEYMAALTKVIESLEKRNEINYFNVAGQFFDPGRTGSFGESVGRASASIGKDIEAQKANAPTLAMMRAQLAGQKYTLENDAKALNIIADNLGIDPKSTQQTLSSGNLSQTQISRIPQLYPMIATLSPTRAAMLKDVFDMQVKGTDVGIKQKEFEIKEGEFKSRFDPDYVLPSSNQKAPTAPAAVPSSVQSSTTPASDPYTFSKLSLNERERLVNTAQEMGLISNVMARSDVADLFDSMPFEKRKAAFIKAGYPADDTVKAEAPRTGDVQVASARVSERRPGETLVAYQERKKAEAQADIDIYKKSIESREATPQKKFDLIAGYDAETVGTTNSKLDSLYKMVNTDMGKKVMSLMNQKGVLTAIAQGAESGITTPIGSISAPAQEMLNKLKLEPREQDYARLIAQTISDLNMGVMKQGKDIFGPQISVYDAQKMAEPGFKSTDSSQVISTLVNKFKIMNHFQGEMNKAQQDYFDRNPTAKTSQFFRSKEFYEVADQYTKTLRKLNELSVF